MIAILVFGPLGKSLIVGQAEDVAADVARLQALGHVPRALNGTDLANLSSCRDPRCPADLAAFDALYPAPAD